MEEYRRAYDERPQDRDLLDKKNHAEEEVAKLWTKRGLDAQSAGKLGDAGEWWRKAIELKPELDGKESAKAIVIANAQTLEQFGDQAVQQNRFDDAFHAWGPLLLVYPDRLDLSNKATDAHKQYAAQLDSAAATLAQKNLLGAALVTDLRALQHDPLHPQAYARAAELRKTIHSRSAVSIPAVTLDDQGWWNLGVALVPKLNRHLGEYPPYGPTKNAAAIPATFTVTIEDFDWHDTTLHYVEAHEGKGTEPHAKGEKVTNPRWDAESKLVAALQKELEYMQAGATTQADRTSPWIHAGDASADAAATPTPAPTPVKKGKKSRKKIAATEESATPRKPLDARKATADEIAKKKDEVEKAKAELAKIPKEIPAGEDTTWYSQYAETTRTAHAKVRFEVREPDFDTPVTKELDLTYEVKDRWNDADPAHSIAADPLNLPPIAQMLDGLSDKFVEDGVATIKDARTRRAERWLASAKEHRSAGQSDEALDADVRAMFLLGVDGVPSDARSAVVARLDGQDPKVVVAGP